MKTIFDIEFNGTPRIDMYRSWLIPDMYPDEKPCRLENWSREDLEMYT